MILLADELKALRPALMRVACQRVRNEAWAEDAVSETLLAALENPDSYAGRAKLRTWLIGVLKHKLVDQIRRGTRESQFVADEDDGAGADIGSEAARATFDGRAPWGDPLDSVHRHQVLAHLDACLGHLPPQQARAFVLRYGMDEDTEEICRQLQVSAGNLSVMLHRARLKLGAAMQPWATSAACA